jgi:hypothetical protein
VKVPFLEVNGGDPVMTLVNNSYLGGGVVFQVFGDGITSLSAFDSTFSTGEIRFQVGFGEMVRITGTGNVGIGNTAPERVLDIAGAGATIGIVNTSAGGGAMSIDAPVSGVAQIDIAGSNALRFNTNGAERARITSTGNFQFNSGYGSVATAYGCRAWVNFNGFNGTIRGSGNVSSVTYNGTGVATVNFATAMPDANYNAVCSAHSAGFGRQSNAFPLYNGYSTGSVIIWYGNTINAAAENMDVVNVSVFR